MTWLNPTDVNFGWMEVIAGGCIWTAWCTLLAFMESGAERQFQREAGEELESAVTYWWRVLFGIAVLNVPATFVMGIAMICIFLGVSRVAWTIASSIGLPSSVAFMVYSLVAICLASVFVWRHFKHMMKRWAAIEAGYKK